MGWFSLTQAPVIFMPLEKLREGGRRQEGEIMRKRSKKRIGRKESQKIREKKH